MLQALPAVRCRSLQLNLRSFSSSHYRHSGISRAALRQGGPETLLQASAAGIVTDQSTTGALLSCSSASP